MGQRESVCERETASVTVGPGPTEEARHVTPLTAAVVALLASTRPGAAARARRRAARAPDSQAWPICDPYARRQQSPATVGSRRSEGQQGFCVAGVARVVQASVALGPNSAGLE